MYEVIDSKWLAKVLKQQLAAGDRDRFKHFIVQGHDNYVEVVATGFSLRRVPREVAGYLKWLIDSA